MLQVQLLGQSLPRGHPAQGQTCPGGHSAQAGCPRGHFEGGDNLHYYNGSNLSKSYGGS